MNDDRAVIFYILFFLDCKDIFSFFKIVLWYLFALGKYQFISFFIQQQNFFFPYLVYFSADDLTDPVTVFFGQYIFFQITDPAGQRLLGSQNGPATKIKQVYFFIKFFAYFKIRLYF